MPKIHYQGSREYHQSHAYREPQIPERTIQVSRYGENKHFLELRFSYNDNIIAFIKTIPGRHFIPQRKLWIVPDTAESRRLIKSIKDFGWYYFIDDDVAHTEPTE